jgi:hypothetical protein
MLFRALLSAFLALPGALYAGDTPGELHSFEFGGVNNSADPMLIAAKDAQDAANVITDEGDLRPMPGSLQHYNLGKSTVSFLGSFVDESARKVIITQSGAEVLASTTSGTFGTIQTLSAVRDIDGVQAFKRYYIVDGTARPFYYTGGSTATAAGMDACRYVEFYANRLVCVNLSTDTSRVALSAYNLPENWTVTTTADSAVLKYFHKDDGQPIRCVKTTPYGLFIGKDGSAGLLKGSDADTFWWYDLSLDIGCIDDRSVQMVDGAITWLSRRGVAAWAGSGRPSIVSEEIRNTTKNILAADSSEQTWAVSTKNGWQLGNGAGWDYDITAGSIKARTYNSGALTTGSTGYVIMFANSGFEAADGTNWTGAFTSVASEAPYAGLYHGRMDYAAATLLESTTIQVLNAADNAVINQTTWTATACSTLDNDIPTSSWQLREFAGISGSGNIKVKLIDAGGNTHVSSAFDRVNGVRVYRRCWKHWSDSHYREDFDTEELRAQVTSSTSATYDSGLTDPPYAVDFKGTNVILNFEYSADSNTWSIAQILPGGTLPAAATERYWKYYITYSSGVAISSFTSVSVSAFSTSTYTSPVYNVGADLAAWGTFSLAGSESEVGLSSVQVRSSASVFDEDAASPAWLTQTNNANVAAALGAHLQYRILPNITTSTQTASFVSSVVNWTNGTLAPRPASLYYDGRYLLCTSTTSTTQNDLCLLWQRNKKWVPMVGPSYASLMVHDDTPMAGDGSSGSKIYDILRDGIYTYSGEAMNSYWITKDYSLGALNNHKVIDRLWVIGYDSTADNFGVAWQADRDGVWNSTTTSLANTAFTDKEVEGLFETDYPGRQFRFKFSSSDLGKYFKLKNYSLYYRVNDLIK